MCPTPFAVRPQRPTKRGPHKINREIERTINDQAEHALFPAYHNGLTMLTNQLEVAGNELRLDGITVVNGCQSLLALHRNQCAVSDGLRVLVKGRASQARHRARGLVERA